MKNKIAGRLLLYFSTALLFFAVIVGVAFSLLFANHTTVIHKQDLENRAVRIADNLSGYLTDGGRGGGHGMGGHSSSGFGVYMNLLAEMAMTDMWVVDANSMFINTGHGHESVSYGELPADGEKVIRQALEGKTSFSESFSELLDAKSITVGAPIPGPEGEPIGVVLLHSPLADISHSVVDGLKILGISICAAMALAAPAALHFSLRFTKPLNRMKRTALCLADGDYTAKSGIVQKDEIGELASAMDILTDRLHDAADQNERMEQMRRTFISNISHELRTPVTVLRGSLEALCDGVVDDPAQVEEYHEQMLSESIHLQRLVNDLLDLSRLQNVDFVIEKAPLTLRELTEDVARGMRHVAEKKGITVTLDSGGDDCPFQGDYSRLRQMLMIVMDNAIKFSETGGDVFLKLSLEQGKPIITVTDKGCGIPEEELPWIFDRFHRAATAKNKDGTGLGLAIAKQIAFRHGVEVGVESRPGHTVFGFRFPEGGQREAEGGSDAGRQPLAKIDKGLRIG